MTKYLGPRCGSCRREPGTIKLPQTGFWRCLSCWEAMQVVCVWPQSDSDDSPEAWIPQPSLPVAKLIPTSQPFAPLRNVAVKVAADFKKQAGVDA